MTTDHNDIHSIVKKLAMLEGRLTPTSVSHGLNPQQKSVPQLPALFHPKHISVLNAKKDPKHPMSGYAVGADESVEYDKEVVEDVLDTVKKSFGDYLKNLEHELKSDPDLKDRIKSDSDLKSKVKKDSDLMPKKKSVKEDPTQQETQPDPQPVDLNPSVPVVNPTLHESPPVKTVAIGNNAVCEIHGNETDGFEIRRGQRRLPTKFRNLEEAEMALAVYQHRRPRHHQSHNQSDDYVDERGVQDECMGYGTLTGEGLRK
jgi:hypothetical protein